MSLDFSYSSEDNKRESTIPIGEAENLWIDFKQGNYLAFAKLYDLFYQPLFNYGSRFTRNNELVKDCIHELFVKLWKTKENLAEAQNPKGYLMVSLRRIILRSIEKDNRYQFLSLLDTNFEIELSHEHILIANQEKDEIINKVKQALEKLSKRQREIVFLKFYEKMTNEEIAAIMKLDLQSVYNLMSRSINNLRDHLLPSNPMNVASTIMVFLAFCF
jgi:RNA polymerase sigma factor (sigma-70 family)